VLKKLRLVASTSLTEMSAEASAHSGPPSGSPDSFEKVNAELRGKYGAHSLTVKSTAVDVYTNYRLLEYMKGLEIIDLSVGIPPPDPKQPAETVGSNPPQNLQVPKVGKSASGGSRNARSDVPYTRSYHLSYR
jgi:hypothetical protein